MTIAVQTPEEMLAKASQMFADMKAILANPEAAVEDLQKVITVKPDGTKEHGPMWVDYLALKAKALSLQELATAREEALPHVEEKARQSDGSNGGAEAKLTWQQYLIENYKAGDPTRREAMHPALARLRWKNVWDEDPENKERQAKDLSGASGSAGGFLIPAEFQATLKAELGERSIVRSRATIIRMARRQVDIPVLDQTGTTAGQPHWFGGMRFYWAEEASEKTSTDAVFRQVSLVAHKLIGYTRASDELLDDSAISLSDFLAGPLGMAGGIAWMEDYAFLRGTGAGQPLGVIPAGCTIHEGRVAAGDVQLDDIIDMLEHFLPGANGVWVANQTLLPRIYTLNGPAGNASYVWIPNARDKAPGTLFGYPLIFSEKPPALGTEGDIGIYDFAYYLLGDRQATTVESTQYDRWRYDQTSWRAVHRVDGQPWLSTWFTLQDGTSTVSPFVILGGAVGS